MSVMDQITELAAKLAPDVLRELVKLVTTILQAPERDRLVIAKRAAIAAASRLATENAVDEALKR